MAKNNPGSRNFQPESIHFDQHNIFHDAMRSIHRPPHLLQDDLWYHITASTYKKQRFFQSDESKTILKNLLLEKSGKFNVTIRAWVILNNHYHLLCHFSDANNIVPFIRELHGASAYNLNQLDGSRKRSVWQNYWDTCIRDEHQLWTGFNYIHQNPVKHGYVKKMESWPFSSYGFWLEKQGIEWMASCLEQYPVVDFTGAGRD